MLTHYLPLNATHDRQLSYLLQDCSAAIQNLLLCAHAHGLGACWLKVHPCEKRMAALKRMLSFPDDMIPVAGVSVGQPVETKEARTRYRADYVHREGW